MISILLNLRNFIVKNFFVDIHCIKFNKYNLNKSTNICLFFLLKFIPFIILIKISKLLKLELIYNIDNIYYITNMDNEKILPVIFKFELINDYNQIDLTSEIKYYNGSLPLSFFIINNNLLDYNILNIKYIKNGKVINKKIIVEEHMKTIIYNLFEN